MSTPPGGTGGTGGSARAESGCAAASGRAGRLLPRPEQLEAGLAPIRVALENPCIPLADLVGTVLDLVPASAEASGEREITDIQKASYRTNLDKLTGRVAAANELAGRVLAANQVVTCGYDTDHLAIAVYQHPDYPWSVGVAAVIRGDIDAGLDITRCYIESLIPGFPSHAPHRGARPAGPRFGVCGSVTRPTRQGEVYTVLTAGNSDQMCAFLHTAG